MLTSPHREENPVLGYRFVISDENGVRELSTADEIEAFLAEVNTFNEAALVLSLRSIWTDRDDLTQDGPNYLTEYTRSSGCSA